MPGALGARLSGGGFGGITIHLVETEKIKSYEQAIKELYKSYSGKEPETIISQPGSGAN